MANILQKVRAAIEVDQVPIVISDWHLSAVWDKDLFSVDGISKHFSHFTQIGSRRIKVRDQDNTTDKDIGLKEFLELLSQEKCPYYWKDEDQIPKAWDNFLMELLPEELTFCGPFDLNTRFKDNPKVSSSNLMSYIGGHGSSTPCHFDYCGSVGHNLMTWAYKDSSSLWYIASPKDYGKVKQLWDSWGKFFEQENYCATVDELMASEFLFYRVDQKPGDLIILPPMAPHQVYNKGKATVKLAWNRITPETALNAVQNILPRYKEIAHPEAYKVKAAVHAAILGRLPLMNADSPTSFVKSFLVCLNVFGMILYDDWIELGHLKARRKLAFPENHIFQEPVTVAGGESLSLVCTFCQGDIWNRHLICEDSEDRLHRSRKPYLLCMECFGRGRGCPHRNKPSLKIRQCFPLASPIKLYMESVSKITELQESASINWPESADIRPWNAQCHSSSDIILSSATIAYGRYYSYREREKDTANKKIKRCSECQTTCLHWMSLRCLKQRSTRHKTVKKSSIRKYDYQRKPCESRYCERCIVEHSSTTWFEAIKWDRDFHCKHCIKDQKQHGRKDYSKNQWYADPREYNNMNRGAVDDPTSQAGKIEDNFYAFGRRFPRLSKDGGVDQQRVKDMQNNNNDNKTTRKRQLHRTPKSNTAKRHATE
ncbi:hypothetical protein MVEG_08312 [Podila verticillata NRRL 6337]|nr:hypothetical protein MVEG_08312 [Podila verticillata NRRL 6337]